MKNNKIMTLVKGMIVGGTMLVPGVSGGSMAMILNIYDKLVSAVSSFSKHKKENLLFLSLFSIGGGLGVLLFANPLLHLIEKYPMPMLYFFLGAVAGGIPLIYKQANIKHFSWKVPVYIFLGILIVLLLTILPIENSPSEMEQGSTNFILLILAGFVAAVALVLPGISVSYLLLLMGLYDKTMRAISDFHFPFLISLGIGPGFVAAVALVLPGISVSYLLLLMGLYDKTMRAISDFHFPFLISLGIGLLLGIILTTKILDGAMTKYPQPTYLMILGFVLCSMSEVFPGFPTGLETFICMITLVSGFFIIRLLSWKETSKI